MHFDGIFHRPIASFSFAHFRQLVAIARLNNGNYAHIEFRCTALVERNFLSAKFLTPLQGGIVQKAKVHRLFEFINPVSRDEHKGNVGLNQGDRLLHRMGIEFRLKHLLHQGRQRRIHAQNS